jgi:hypothetical protein
MIYLVVVPTGISGMQWTQMLWLALTSEDAETIKAIINPQAAHRKLRLIRLEIPVEFYLSYFAKSLTRDIRANELQLVIWRVPQST